MHYELCKTLYSNLIEFSTIGILELYGTLSVLDYERIQILCTTVFISKQNNNTTSSVAKAARTVIVHSRPYNLNNSSSRNHANE